jgi:hypothetical protein
VAKIINENLSRSFHHPKMMRVCTDPIQQDVTVGLYSTVTEKKEHYDQLCVQIATMTKTIRIWNLMESTSSRTIHTKQQQEEEAEE